MHFAGAIYKLKREKKTESELKLKERFRVMQIFTSYELIRHLKKIYAKQKNMS